MDTFLISERTNSEPLSRVGDHCIKRFSLDEIFLLKEPVYTEFFKTIEKLYKPNPYHNSIHATDVLCSFLFLIQQSIVADCLEDFEILAFVIAALCHDVGHPGFTNRFLVNSKDHLAILCNFYSDNDISVLEMMHCSTTFQAMQQDQGDLLEHLPPDEILAIRVLIIELILATDMAKHFDIIGKFKAKLISSTPILFTTSEKRLEVLKIIIKASDVGHSAKSLEIHKK